MGTFSPIHWIIFLAMTVPLLALFIVPVWRILKRAGFNGAWALLMFVPVANFMLLWCVAFLKWPNDPEGKTRTSVPWIVVGFVMLPLSIGAMVLMANADVQRVATVEQRARPAPAPTATPNRSTDSEGKPCTEVTEFLGECKRQP